MVGRPMLASVLLASLAALILTSCSDVLPPGPELATMAVGPAPSATGSVQIVFMGGRGEGDGLAGDKLAYAEIAWFDAHAGRPDRGDFHYTVYAADGTLHRAIVAEVSPDDPRTGVYVTTDAGGDPTAYFVGVVTSDSKTAASGGSGSSGSGGEDDACDCGGEDEEGSGGPENPPGNTPRVGEYVAVQVADRGSPAVGADFLTWSWFYPDTTPTIAEAEDGTWPAELCDKPILAGNLTVHLPPGPPVR